MSSTPKLTAAMEMAIKNAQDYRNDAAKHGFKVGSFREELLALALKETLTALKENK